MVFSVKTLMRTCYQLLSRLSVSPPVKVTASCVVESMVFILLLLIAGLQVATDDSDIECTVSDTLLDTRVSLALVCTSYNNFVQ